MEVEVSGKIGMCMRVTNQVAQLFFFMSAMSDCLEGRCP